jgi:enoyl-CoA hydratase/carnithine racemase
MSEPVLYARNGGVVVLTLNLPEQRNPISDPAMVEALVDALERLDADPQARVAILTGAGKAFCAGGDIKKMHAGEGLRDPNPVRTRRNYRTGIQRIPLAFAALETPVIAAINGPAIGAGLDLACMCDIRIAAEGATFSAPFVKLGITPGDGGAWLLPAVVGFARAAELFLTGDSFGPAEALAYGVVSRVTPDAELMQTAQGVAERIAAHPPQAVRLTKRLLWESRGLSLPSALELSAASQAMAHATADHREALAAFLEKRPPRFTGE